MSATVRVFDPALCCSTGVCGPSVDAELVRFAADVEWMKAQGVTVERFNLAQQPGAFMEPAVRGALEAMGEAALPMVKLGEAVVTTGQYPTRAVMAKLLGVKPTAKLPMAAECCAPKAGGAEGGSCC